jgi:hypothetical protein
MAARITVNLNAKGELEIWLNPEGRDILVKELQSLSETNDHFHLRPKALGEMEVSDRPYRPDASGVRESFIPTGCLGRRILPACSRSVDRIALPHIARWLRDRWSRDGRYACMTGTAVEVRQKARLPSWVIRRQTDTRMP